MEQRQEIKKAFFWNSFGIIIFLFCQWLSTVLVVRLSGYEDAGNFALAMTVSNVFYCVAIYNIRAYQVSDIKTEYSDNIYATTRFFTAAVSLFFCTFFLLITDYTVMQRLVIMCYMVMRAIEAFIDVLHGIDQKHWRMDIVGVSFILRGVFMLLFFVLIQILTDLLFAVLGMAAVSLLVVVFFDIPMTRKFSSFSFRFEWRRIFSLLKACFPLMLIGLLNVLVLSLSRYLLERICGTEALGIYVSVVAPTLLVQVAATFVFNPLINIFAAHFKNGEFVQFRRTFIKCCALIAGFIGICLLGITFFGEWVLCLLFGESIRPYAYLLFHAVICTGLTAFIWFMTTVLTVFRDFKGVLIGNLSGFLICLLFTVSLITRHGIAGANYSLILSQGAALGILFVAYFLNLRKQRRNDIEFYTSDDHAFVICAYQESPYLEECIQSLLSQTNKSSVLISTSTPNDFIIRLSEQYEIPLFISPEKRGITFDWDFAYAQTDKKLVTIAHQDDFYEPDYLDYVLKSVNKVPDALILYTDYYELRGDDKRHSNRLLTIKRIMNFSLRFHIFQRVKAIRRIILAFGNPICCPSVTFVKEHLPKQPLFDNHYKNSMDYKAWSVFSKRDGAFVYCPKRLMGHRIYAESTTTANIQDNSRSKEDFEILCDFWPRIFAKLIFFFYKQAEKSNQV
ncbi:MAG: hypothetical protein Ta2G_00770 [Termitinemataceae bacterium]|nr:MAG: hypothetical protein Ta2G_00770 [Termitinemataceae bacterium]